MPRSEVYDKIFHRLNSAPSEGLESDEIEFKEYKNLSTLHSKSQELACELSAFANLNGGAVIIGVKDSSNVINNNWPSQLVGFEEVDCTELERRLLGNLQPNVSLRAINYKVLSKNFLIIEINSYNRALVMTSSGKCYIRSGRDSKPMTPEMVTEKIKSLRPYDWSSETLEDLDIENDLDEEQIEHAMSEHQSLSGIGDLKISTEHFLETIGVIKDGVLTKGGLVFLGKDRSISDNIGMIEYRFSHRKQGGELIKNEIWSGSIWKSIIRFREYLDEVTTYKYFKVSDKTHHYPTICKKASEEAMINSLVHRDFTLEGMTSIEVNDDVVVFTNPGSFFDNVSTENIFKCAPRHRNKVLASILKDFHMLDRAGMGMRRINIDCLRLGRKPAKVLEDNNSVITSFEIDKIVKEIAILTKPYEDDYDVIELCLLNFLYSKSYETIDNVLEEVSIYSNDPWREILKAIERVECLSLEGNKNNIYVIVNKSHKKIMKANTALKKSKFSDSYLNLYKHLKEYTEASSEQLQKVLTINSLKNTEEFLSGCEFIVCDESNNWSLKKN